MLIAAFGDIHANFDAFEAVLAAIEESAPDQLVCVGDVVGYGAEPTACIAALRPLDCIVVAGNHDFGVAGVTDLEYFNPYARDAALWTRNSISRFDKEHLASLRLRASKPPFSLVHGTFDRPAAFLYIDTLVDARNSFARMEGDIGFVGHSHVPITFLQDGTEAPAEFSTEPLIKLKRGQRAIVNVGSVGQPRDEDPRACWVLYDTRERVIRFFRVPYDVERAANKIREAGLPEVLALRLEIGR